MGNGTSDPKYQIQAEIADQFEKCEEKFADVDFTKTRASATLVNWTVRILVVVLLAIGGVLWAMNGTVSSHEAQLQAIAENHQKEMSGLGAILEYIKRESE